MAPRELPDDQRTIPVQALLAPIAGDSPAGVDLRSDPSPVSVYYQLKDARTAARAAERRAAEEELDDPQAGDEPRGVLPMQPEWRVVLENAPKVLAEQSKDLEVAAWLTEALVRAHGIAGVRDGLNLTAGLVGGFWESLFPSGEDGIEAKVAPMTNLNGSGSDGALVQAIRNVPLTAGAPRFAAWHHKAAHQGSGIVSVEQFQASVRDTPPQFFRDLVQDIEDSLGELERCAAAFDEKCGVDAPPTSAIRGALIDIRDIVASVAPEALTAAPAVAAPQPDGASPALAGATMPVTAGPGELRTREDAFNALSKVADFFRRTEPHSPIAYTLDELVRRGRMPLLDLLEQLLPDEDARRTFLLRAGIRPPEPPA